jgi:hypothetical protein
MWVTFPILPEALSVMESWGFKYATCGFNWIKKQNLKEASGHIPVNDEEAKDPRWSNALSVDIAPGEDKKQAAKWGYQISKDGPPKLKTNGKV